MAIEYPPYIVPDEYAKSGKDSTLREARGYFDWLMKIRSQRIEILRAFLGNESPSSAEAELSISGKKVAVALAYPEFSGDDNKRLRKLNVHGMALAADMGLLLALHLMTGNSDVHWVIEKRKTDASFNLPVLAGFGKIHLDPIGGSIGYANGILSGATGSDSWLKGYQHWSKLATDATSMKGVANDSSDALMDLVFFSIDHSLRSLCDDDSMIPFVVREVNGERILQRFVADTHEEAIARAREFANGLIGKADRLTIIHDGYLYVGSLKFNSILVDAYERGAYHWNQFAQRYYPKGLLKKPVTVGNVGFIGYVPNDRL